MMLQHPLQVFTCKSRASIIEPCCCLCSRTRCCRLGAVELMATLVLQLQRQLVPYTVMLVVPLLRRMSDAVPAVRRKAALCFGSLTALLPLAHGLPLPEGLDDGQRADAQRDGEFLSQLLDNRRVEDYSLPMQLKVRHFACVCTTVVSYEV
jgi:TATA-binding protein-associated factor